LLRSIRSAASWCQPRHSMSVALIAAARYRSARRDSVSWVACR
jgi:hypothetical protein